MDNPTPASAPNPSPGWRALVAGGLICGVLDINAAFISAYLTNDRAPAWVLRAVASALLGRDAAFGGGAWVGVMGLGMHFLVAFSWTAVFCLLAGKFPGMLRQAVLAGMAFGLGVYLFMNCITIPVCSWVRSLYLHTPVNWAHAPFGWPQFFIHLTCVGLAISLSVRHWSRRASCTPRPDGHPSS